MESLGERGGAVELDAAGERVEVGQVLGPGLLNPPGQVFVVGGVGFGQCGEVFDEDSNPCHFGAGATRGVDPPSCDL